MIDSLSRTEEGAVLAPDPESGEMEVRARRPLENIVIPAFPHGASLGASRIDACCLASLRWEEAVQPIIYP